MRIFITALMFSVTGCSAEVKVTWRASAGSTRTMYHKITGEESVIERQLIIIAGGETLYVSREVYDAMQAGDTITPATLAKMRAESETRKAAYYDLLDQYLDTKP